MIGSSELIVILILALFLFGPQKLPEMARALGKAVAEYKKAAKDIDSEINKAKKEIETELDMKELKEIAENLNIPTTGKTRTEILKEIAKKTKKSGVSCESLANNRHAQGFCIRRWGFTCGKG